MGGAEKLGPLYSTRAEEPEVSEALDAFVLALAERIDDLQDAELSGDLPRVADQATPLGEKAETLGYEVLAQASTRVTNACAAGDGAEVRKQLEELTDIAQRVRLGHRGAL